MSLYWSRLHSNEVQSQLKRQCPDKLRAIKPGVGELSISVGGGAHARVFQYQISIALALCTISKMGCGALISIVFSFYV